MNSKSYLRIALLEDSRDQAERMSDWIESADAHCVIYSTAEEFQQGFRQHIYDLVILDWVLSKGSSGLDILHWIRKTVASDVPIIFATVRDSEKDIVTAMLAGADDYLAKPIRRLELLARISALVRRSTKQVTNTLTYPPYELNTTSRELRLNDKLVRLTEKEFELALYLFQNQDRSLSREHLLTSVWGTSPDVSSRTVDTHASRLRKKLKLHPPQSWRIISVYQYGYRLEKVSGQRRGHGPTQETDSC